MSLLRKFSRKVQGAGIVQTVRNRRYHARPGSKAVKKKQALKRISRKNERDRLIKEGKMAEPAPRRGAPPPRESTPRGGLGESTPIAR